MRELQALCLDIAAYKVGANRDTKLEDNEINLMEEFQDESEVVLLSKRTEQKTTSLGLTKKEPNKFFISENF